MSTSQSPSIEKVCVVGLGYIGLPTAAFIADSGISVLGVDINQEYVDKINRGEVPFFEPGFETMLRDVVKQGKLKADTVPHLSLIHISEPTRPY